LFAEKWRLMLFNDNFQYILCFSEGEEYTHNPALKKAPY